MQGLAHAGIGVQIESKIGFDLVFIQESEVPVRPAMSANLEKRIGQELLGPLNMIEEPFPARKEGCLDAQMPQSINDLSVIAGDFVSILTEIERQGQELLPMQELYAAYRTAHVSRYGGKTNGFSGWLDRDVVWNPMNCFLTRLSGQCLGGPAGRARRRQILRPARRLEWRKKSYTAYTGDNQMPSQPRHF
jgi:hypothetical protein